MRTAPIMLAAALVVAGACAALAPMPARSADSPPLAAADRTFMMDAATAGMVEVKLGDVASQRAANEAVKDFGQRMVRDHSKAGDELTKLATSKGVTLPKELSAEHQAMIARLDKLSGSQFDQAYMRQMVKDHVQAVATFQKESTNGGDTDVKTWATRTLPTLKEHLQVARDVAKRVGVPETSP